MNIAKNRRRLAGQALEALMEQGQDVRHALAMGSKWSRCVLTDCDFSSGDYGNATFDRCTFIRCDFRHSILMARFHECVFDDCNLDSAAFVAAEIRDCSFSGRAQFSNWERATVLNTALSIDLHSARLDFAEGHGIDWTGANLWNALIPMGCAFFAGSTIDARQANMFLSLLLETQGGFEHGPIEDTVNPLQRRAVARLMRSVT